MSRFIVTLTEEERALLEAHRARLGLRSQADTVRRLIRETEGRVGYVDPVKFKAVFTEEITSPKVPYGSRLKKR